MFELHLKFRIFNLIREPPDPRLTCPPEWRHGSQGPERRKFLFEQFLKDLLSAEAAVGFLLSSAQPGGIGLEQHVNGIQFDLRFLQVEMTE